MYAGAKTKALNHGVSSLRSDLSNKPPDMIPSYTRGMIYYERRGLGQPFVFPAVSYETLGMEKLPSGILHFKDCHRVAVRSIVATCYPRIPRQNKQGTQEQTSCQGTAFFTDSVCRFLCLLAGGPEGY